MRNDDYQDKYSNQGRDIEIKPDMISEGNGINDGKKVTVANRARQDDFLKIIRWEPGLIL